MRISALLFYKGKLFIIGMYRYLRAFLFVLWTASLLYPQTTRDTTGVIKHTAFTLQYEKTFGQSRWVSYKLTAARVKDAFERPEKFIADPLAAGGTVQPGVYEGTGYVKGQLCPAADMSWNEQAMKETFYMSNVSPLRPGFNSGIWKKLEAQVRTWATVNGELHIVTGPVIRGKLPFIGKNRCLAVPALFFKAILDDKEPGIKTIGFVLPNKASKEPLSHFAVTIDSLENLTGINFFKEVPDSVEDVIESVVYPADWGLE